MDAVLPLLQGDRLPGMDTLCRNMMEWQECQILQRV